MPTHRRSAACYHPLFLTVFVTLGMVSIFAVLVTSLAQAHGLPPAMAAGAASANKPYFAQELPSHGAVPADKPALEYTPGVVLVKLKAAAAESLARPGMAATQGMDVSAAGTANLLRSYGVTSAEPLFAAAVSSSGYSAQAAQGGEDTLSRVFKLHLAPQLDAGQIAAALAADSNVEYAEPDYIARGIRMPNDPEYGSQWALAKVGAPAAWDLQTGSPDVVIALIDSGVDTAQPEFAGRLWENDDPINGVNDDSSVEVDDLYGWNYAGKNNDIRDANGHGTQVAGVLGAAADNSQGIAGLCWGCKLMFVNAMQPGGIANYSDIARAVIYASSNDADVINLALGGYADSAVLADAIREAATRAVIVGGAGNDDSADPFYPAAYPEVLAVAATDENDQKAIFSNYGSWVSLSAPGANIRTTVLGGGYADESGTSLATAYVSALAGMVKSLHPQWTSAQVKWQLLNTAANIDAANPTMAGKLGRGRIDAAAALAYNPQAQAVLAGYILDGAPGARPAPGQSFQLVLLVQNQWLPAQNLQGTLTSSDPNVTIADAAGSFGDIAPGQSGSNSGDPFGVSVGGAAAYNALLPFTLALRGDGGYSLDLPFTLQVRSAVETLGNTQYSQNTTWTNDKTYVLAGSVIVGQGVTLTIQPGTVVKADGGKFIRIDGTLIAQGTAEQPILFTSNAPPGTAWSGIRFTASAANAALAEDGSYTGGSILRHVEVSGADIGASLAGRTPYIADSSFAGNGLAIQTWADGAPGGRVHIEHSRFVGNAISVVGGATVVQNDFAAGSARGDCGIVLNGGSPLIMQNSFSGGCSIGGGAGYPNVVSNTLQGGTIALSLSNGPGGRALLPPFLQEPPRKQLAAGIYYTCALLETGSVQCWGFNMWGQIGIGTNDNASTPQAVVGLTGATAQLAAGIGHTCALLESGSLQCWGRNVFGQLGVSSYADANTPQIVPGLAGAAKQVAAGYEHTCALLVDGSVECWGRNVEGQLGTGSNTNATTPQAVQGLAGAAKQLAAGGMHTCAVLEDGSVQCWGWNVEGQLGTGSSNNANTPQPVIGLAGSVTELAAGEVHTCALLESGSVQCWGRNGNGQLGTGNNSSATTPQAVTGLAGAAKQVAAGSEHTCALLVDGSVQCWGRNAYGQLGTGTINGANTPRNVVGLGGAARQLTAGSEHTCALLESGSVQCWGYNGFGALGTGGTDGSNTPQEPVPSAIYITGNSVQNGAGLALGAGAGNWLVQQNSAIAGTGGGIAFSCSSCSAQITGNTAAGNQSFGLQLGGGGRLNVAGNDIANNQGAGIAVTGIGKVEIMTNTIAGNQGYGLQFGGSSAAVARVQQNNLVGNGAYEIYLESGAPGTQNFTLDAASNYWNVPSASISARIRDCTFDENGCGSPSATVGKISSASPLSAPEQAAPAFAAALALQPDTVGVEAGTLVVEFSKPMATAVLPVAQFQQAPDLPQYLFENGRWISSTRFEATFDFTALIAPGYYTVTVEGALDGGGMPAYAAKANAFRVYFGAGVSLDPPNPPSVAAQTTGSLANLAASWIAAGAQIDQYRYAIGTAPGARNIVGWTYLVSTSFVRDDLNLTRGQTYYVTVQAHNSSGIWSANGVSNGVVGGQAVTQTFIQPGTGGTQAGQFGSLELSLHVPPNATGEPIRLSMQPAAAPPATGGLAILGQSFAINAETAGGAPVTQFAVPLVLVLHYTDTAAAGLDESRLQIFYWNEAQQKWVGVPTVVDAQANTLTVYLDHLTLFAALETQARNPSLYLPQIRR